MDLAVRRTGCDRDGASDAIASLVLAAGGAGNAGSLATTVVFDEAAEPVFRRHHARVKRAPRVDRATGRLDCLLVWYAIKASAAPRLFCAPEQCFDFCFVRFNRLIFFVPERRDLSVLELPPIGIVTDLLERLAAIRDLHQFGGAASADVELSLEKRLPLFPRAGVAGLERSEVLAGGNVMLLGLLAGVIALGNMRPDRVDQSLLIRAGDDLG